MFAFLRTMFRLIQSYLPQRQQPVINQTRKLFVTSIGNPEPEYAGTRHNVGHEFVNQLVKRHWKDHLYEQGGYIHSSKFPSVVIYKSNDSYMNLQGRFVSRNYSRFPNSALLVVHDELQVKLGKFQVRGPGTSARGHNGLKSINQYLPNNYTKFLIGIDKPNTDVVKFVMQKFTPEQQKVLEDDVFPKLVERLEEMAEEENNKGRL